MANERTLFEQACIAQGWDQPGKFVVAFERTAALLGEPVTVTTRHARRWMREIPPPSPRARPWRVIHAMFGVDPSELGFLHPPPGVTVRNAPLLAQEGSTDVHRRAFLADSIGVTAAVTLPPAPATALSSRGTVGTAHLLELREGLRSLYHLDDAYGGGDVRSLAVKHLRRVRRVINQRDYPDTIGASCGSSPARPQSTAPGCSTTPTTKSRRAHTGGEALTTATMLRETALEILVLASLSMQASFEGRPRDGYDLARAAHERAAQYGSPVLQSLIASREARALSLMRDGSGATPRLADSMRLVERADRGRPSPDWAAFHGHAELDYAQGLLYTETGHHGRAASFLRAALDHQDRTYGRNRALYRLTLARSLVTSDEVDEGAAQAVASLEHLDEVESGRVLRRLTEVVDLLGGTDAASAREAASELTEYVHERGAA